MKATSCNVIGIIACLFLSCGCVAGLQAAPKWQLIQSTLPDVERSGVESMQFSPDGSRILLRGSRDVELLERGSNKKIISFKAKGGRFRFAPYLANGAAAYDNVPTPELLLPDLTRQALPAETSSVSNDGKFAFVETRQSDGFDSVREVAGGREICAFRTGNSLQQVTFSSRYATIGTRAGFALCDLEQGEITWLVGSEEFDRVTGWVDPQSRWLLVIWHKKHFIRDITTRAILYPLPLVAKRAVERDSGRSGIEVAPVRRWDSHDFNRAAFSPDGRWLTLISERRVELMRLDALDDPVVADPNFVAVKALFSRDSRWLALQGEDKIFLADLSMTPQLSELKPPLPIAMFTLHDIAPDGCALLATTRTTVQDHPLNVIWHITPTTSR